MATIRTAFLDANVVRGQLTTDIMLTLAAERLYRPKWSPEVQAEAIRNKPPGASEQAVSGRFAQMNKVFPAAMTTGYEELAPQMRADEKDKHVLAAAVQSKADVLVTENSKDFDPPSKGAHAMKIERTSEFLNRVLEDNPGKVVSALQKMVDRNRRAPQTMPELIDKMATQAAKAHLMVSPRLTRLPKGLRLPPRHAWAPPTGRRSRPTRSCKRSWIEVRSCG